MYSATIRKRLYDDEPNFWLQQGFNKIIEYDGAKQFSETAQASLILEKRLK